MLVKVSGGNSGSLPRKYRIDFSARLRSPVQSGTPQPPERFAPRPDLDPNRRIVLAHDLAQFDTQVDKRFRGATVANAAARSPGKKPI